MIFFRPTNSRVRRQCGATLADTAGGLALLMPLILLMIFAVVEASEYFVLKHNVASVARQAANEIAYSYGALGNTSMNSGGTKSGAANASDATYLSIINAIAVPNVVKTNSNTQYQAYFFIPNSPSMKQAYVTATVTYQNGTNLPPFPWNPIQGTFDKFSLSGITVKSSASWPIPN